MKNFFTNKRGELSVPLAIIIAGLIIGISVIYAVGKKSVTAPVVADDDSAASETANVLDKVRAVAADDHILGDLDAPVKVVEFSDPECPFCKRFHGTMQQVVAEYGDKVAWVYRHFPLDSLHPKARKEAEAMECAAELGGNDAFWKYANRLYEVTPSNNGLDPAELPKIAQYVGLDAAKFSACLASGKHAERVAKDYNEAVASGGQGTPYSVVINASGKKTTIPGALPLDSVKAIIDEALR
ncbi:MAG: thioredoxin domain-containing protein [Candidatus Harrisonbacteria bacterium]|nr:thioredoxin domain-containing protein [Candidatus Harrisonbacteria bacterium]